ncbi:MAG TPA: hypothetical protein ENN85_06790 [Methanoculleus sp.]|nr:hypothetical protein [Methanoculleus sp.]
MTGRWEVILTVKVNVDDAGSREEAVGRAIEDMKERFLHGYEIPVVAHARKMNTIAEEEHLFGVNRYF